MTATSPVIGPGNGILPRSQMSLTASTVLDFTASDTYEKIAGTWAGTSLSFFTATEAGVLTYSGPDNCCFLFSGTSDCTATKISELSYALFKNGELITGAETPFTVGVPLRVRNVSITAIINLNKNDYLEVFAKCNDNTSDLRVSTLTVTFWGDHR